MVYRRGYDEEVNVNCLYFTSPETNLLFTRQSPRQVTGLKLVKRRMYGRAKIDLL